MPKISELFNDYVVYMYNEANTRHNLPHIHVMKSDIQIVVDFCGNVLEGDSTSIPRKDLAKILRWVGYHKAELEQAWAAVSSGLSPQKIANTIPPRVLNSDEEDGCMAHDVSAIYKSSLDIKVCEVFALPNNLLLCQFAKNEFVLYDVTEWLRYPAFAKLQKSAEFRKVSIVFGNPTWQDLNEEITAYDIYTDGIRILSLSDVEFLKGLSQKWLDENDGVMRLVLSTFLQAKKINFVA